MKSVTAILIFFACIGQAAVKGGITIEMQPPQTTQELFVGADLAPTSTLKHRAISVS